jgi:hypothetical protein
LQPKQKGGLVPPFLFLRPAETRIKATTAGPAGQRAQLRCFALIPLEQTNAR